MALSDAKVRAAKAADKPYKLTDAQQLYLFVTTAGTRIWRLNYKFGKGPSGKPANKTLTLGQYPAISLKDARDLRDMAKADLAIGKEPVRESLLRRLAGQQCEGDTSLTFQTVGEDWLASQLPRWSSVHGKDVTMSLNVDVFPSLGELPIDGILAPTVLECLRAIVNRGAVETAHRTRQRISAIFVYAIAMGYCSADPAANLGPILPKVPKAKSQPALTDIDDLRQMIRDCEAQVAKPTTKLALRLIALTAARPNEIHQARWQEFYDLDGDEPLWRIPASRMKGDLNRKADSDGDHLIPLAPQAVAVIKAVAHLTGHLQYLFPSERHTHRPMSENTLRAILIRAGYYQRHVPHGFRAAFSTIMNERAELSGAASDRAIIDLMLAHVPDNKVEGAYNRAAYMPRRREIANEWADLIMADMPDPIAMLDKRLLNKL